MSFYPDQPTKHHRITKIWELTGWKPKFIYWQDKTVCDFKDKGEGINRHCRDIRKSTVAHYFHIAFGYHLEISENTKGKGVIKSDENYKHDGQVFEFPRPIPDGKVAERFIDTKTSEGYIDWRPVIVNGHIKCVLKKVKDHIFKTSGTIEVVHRDVFTFNERTKIEKFCSLIGMDYGEPDVLRDKDGKIYIVDANKTPGGAGKVEKLNDVEMFVNAHRGLFV